MSTHQLDLFENSLDSLAEALNKYEQGDNGDNKAYKFAVLHLSHFMELILKHHVAQKHPLLIYKDPFAQKLDRNKTITLWEAINFINNESEEVIDKDFRKDLEWLKRLRNDIEHHKFEMDVQEVRITIGRIFSALIAFLDEYTDLDIQALIPVTAVETFKVLSDEYEFSLREATREADKIENEYEAHYDYKSGEHIVVRLDCPECDNYTLVINEDSHTGFSCTFCGNEDSDDIPKNCTNCGMASTIGELDCWIDDDGNEEARCYYCSGRHFMNKDD